MRWIIVWLGALRGAGVAARTQVRPVVARTVQVSLSAVVALSFSTLSGVVPKLPDQWSEALEWKLRQSS